MENLAQGFRHAQRAVSLDDTDSRPHVYLGWVHMFRREYERANRYFDRAIALNPNDSDAIVYRALAIAYGGHPEAAIELAKAAMRPCTSP